MPDKKGEHPLLVQMWPKKKGVKTYSSSNAVAQKPRGKGASEHFTKWKISLNLG